MRIQLVAAAFAMSVTGCGDNADSGMTGSGEPTTASSSAAMAVSDYVSGAANGDMYEIESSKLALERATNDAVKQFAERMIRDHEGTSAALRRFVETQPGGALLPSGLDARHRTMVDALRTAPAEQFDRLYMMQQMAAHDEALALHRGYAESGDNVEARALASRAVRIIEQHHELLRAASPQGTPSQDTGQMQRSSPGTPDSSQGSDADAGN